MENSDLQTNTATSSSDLLQELENAWKIIRTEPAKAREIGLTCLSIGEERNDKKVVAFAQGCIGSALVWMSEYEEALKRLLDAHGKLIELEEYQQDVQVLYMLGVIYYFLGDPNKQKHYCQQAFDTAQRIGDKPGMASSLNGLGTVCYTNNQNEEAISYLEQALELCDEIGEEDVKIRVLDGLGQAYFHLRNFEQALLFKEQCLEIARKKDIRQVMSYALDGIGEIHTNLNDLPKAISHYEEALTLRHEMGFKSGEAETMLHIGYAYFKGGDMLNAKQHMMDALEMGRELNSGEIVFKAHRALSEVYEEMGNLKGFAEHFKRYHQLKEEFHSKKTEQKIRTAELEGKLRKAEEEKKLLQDKNEQLESYYKDVKTLSEIGQELTSTLDLKEILRSIYNRVNSLMDASVFLIGLHDEEEQVLRMTFAIEKDERFPEFIIDLKHKSDRVAAWVAKNKKEAIINDFDSEIANFVEKAAPPAIGDKPESIIYLPLLVNEKLVGILSVQSFSKNAYNDYHVNMLRNLAVYAGIAIENANRYSDVEEEVTKRTQEVEQNYQSVRLLNSIGKRLISTLDISAVFEELHSSVTELMSADCFAIRLVDTEKHVINYKYEIERDERHPEVSVSLNQDNNYSVWCYKNKKSIFINDNTVEYTRYVTEIQVVAGDFPHSLIFQPLLKGEEVYGVITVQSFEKNAYTKNHLNMLETLASYTVIALENAHMYERMEKEVQERTKDVIVLSELGQKITSQLSIQKINEVIYESISEVMDAPSFGLGIYDKTLNAIKFPGYLEKGKVLDESVYYLEGDDRMATVCFNQEIDIVINNYAEEHGKYVKVDSAPIAGESVTSLIYLPLWVKGEKVGVITVQSFQENAYKDYHVNFVRNLGVYAGIAIENAQLYEGLEDMVKERTKEVIAQKEEIESNYKSTELLSQIGREITSSLSIEVIVSKVYNNINSLMDATCFGIGIYDSRTEQIVLPGFIENNKRMDEFAYHVNDERLASYCFRNEEIIYINDYSLEFNKYIKGMQQPVSGKDASSIMYVPVYSKEKPIGVITVQSFKVNSYTDNHLNILKNLAVYVGIAIENATLYEHLEDKVKERTQEVIQQKEIIEEKNKSITDSIKYAKRIQDATLPDAESIKSYFQDAFVLFKPKDIVSGDFYWFDTIMDNSGNPSKILFAVVDCTGHGVPGAFMSLIGNNALNQIVHEYKINEPAQILTQLDELVSKTLSQNKEYTEIKDGMDLAICSYDIQNSTIEFAGAYNPLWIVRNGEIIEIKGDKIAIGLSIVKSDQSFRNHKLELESGDEIYVFSDGFADQFGGSRGKKLKVNRFKEILTEPKTTMHEKCKWLDACFEEWRGEFEQLDDVCVVGMRVA